MALNLACTAMAHDFSFNKYPHIQVLRIGEEQQPLLIVDDLLNEPEDMLEYATQGTGFAACEDDFYPGIKKAAPPEYAESLSRISSAMLAKVFDLASDERLAVDLSELAITTTAPENLLPIQSIPHFDTLNSDQFAVVHYLFKPPRAAAPDTGHSGTSFYRHRHTRFESIDSNRVNSYKKTLEREATTVGLPEPGYVQGDSRLFERIARVEARFNRAVFYRSNVLHSGDIPLRNGLSSNPLIGRLTVTTSLLGYRAASPSRPGTG